MSKRALPPIKMRSYFSLYSSPLRLHAAPIDALFALVLGGLHTLTFAPTPHGGWLALLTLSAFFIVLARTSSTRAAAQQGLFFGLGHFSSGLAWLVVSMHVYGALSLLLSLILLLLCVLYLSLYPALASGAWRAMSLPRATAPSALSNNQVLSWHSSICFACLWVLTEWLRGTLLTGFPWLTSGYTQVDGPLAGYASIFGVYGLSWLLAWIAALGAQALIACKPQWLLGVSNPSSSAAPRPSMPDRTRQMIGVRLVVCVALMGIASASLHIPWTRPQGTPLKIRLLQGNVPQSTKINASSVEGMAAIDDMLTLYQKLITEAPADLILTPETAAPLPLDHIPESFARTIRQFSDQTGSSILLGGIGRAPVMTSLDEYMLFHWTNSLFCITPHNPAITVYNKRHLVPFGEYIPWGFEGIMSYLQLPLASFARGALKQSDFRVHDQMITASICYEDIFGEELARTLRKAESAAHFIVNATNLGWFGNTLALAQHRQMAQMRALETARPLLSAANTGITAAIDPHGKIIAALPPFTTGSLQVTLRGYAGKTPYIFYGNLPVLIGVFGWLIGTMVYASHRRRKS